MFEHSDAFDEQYLPHDSHDPGHTEQFPGSYADDPPGWCDIVPEDTPCDNEGFITDLQPAHDTSDTYETETDLPAAKEAVEHAWHEVRERAEHAERPVGERPSPGDMRKHVFYEHADGRLIPHHHPDVDKHISDIFNNKRAEILGQFTSETAPFDVARCNDFIEKLGLSTTKTALFLPQSEQRAVLDKLWVAEPRGDSDYAGLYSNQTDIIFNFYDGDADTQHPAERAELAHVHELFHSAGANETLAIGNENGLRVVRTSRMGHQTQSANGVIRGKFIEEGVAEYLAGKYAAEELGKPHGLAELPREHYTFTEGRTVVTVPSLYVNLSKDGEPISNPSAYAATAIGHLVERDPKLLPAFIHGSSDIEAKREMIGRMEAIEKSLYTILRDFFNDYDMLHAGLMYVRTALGIPRK